MNVGVLNVGASAAARTAAAGLAQRLCLPLLAVDDGSCDLLLAVTDRRVELRETASSGRGALYVDWVHRRAASRPAAGGSRGQPLARAIGLRRGKPTVVDATAGLGGDTLLLAGWGCTVTAVERCGVVHALLRDGIMRARAEGPPALGRAVERVSLLHADARVLLTQLDEATRPDLVYLDPMYPPRRKATALAKKHMRILRTLVGDDPDAGELLDIARRVARHRVVVKRLCLAPPLADNPVARHCGKIARYDVYLPHEKSGLASSPPAQ
ncbi:MAG TPA: class I SAM-dependent methyltransferase [Phycisphaerae bacterium]|nr:class I SAM-dependent methyltransferase [Phycisphaerae bacterium]HNU45560.1 class I SAM-dependent methyltransferase [Phycisphaerae bacterium]